MKISAKCMAMPRTTKWPDKSIPDQDISFSPHVSFLRYRSRIFFFFFFLENRKNYLATNDLSLDSRSLDLFAIRSGRFGRFIE